MSILISEAAAERIADIKESKSYSDAVPLRISVVGGGCSGLSYNIDFDENGENPQKHDQIFVDKGVKIVVDMRSFLYLAGTELDFSEGLQGKGFHFKNPNATRTCSCGESFSV